VGTELEQPASGDSSAPYWWMLCGSAAFALMGKWTGDLHPFCTWQVPALCRSFLALVFAAMLVRAGGARLVLWRPGILWLRSFAGSCSLVCTFYAMSRMPLPEVLTLTNTFPIWVALLSWPLLGERPGLSVWLSAVSGVAGVALIQLQHMQLTGGDATALVALAASFFTAIAMMGLNRLKGIDARAIVVHFSAVAVLFCVAAYFVLPHDEQPGAEPSLGPTLLLLLGVGVTATVGQLFLTRAFAAGTASKVAVIGLTQVVFALLIDPRVWRGQIDLRTAAGIVLVIAPTAWLLLSARRRSEPEA
jgi:drug/metabolite transporter (DMT)-like permease